jgi:anti-sigma B factor antagonist
MAETPGQYVVQPEGELDLATVAPLSEGWTEAIDAMHPALFVIDLAKVTFLDGTALGAIIRVYKRQHEHGGDALVVNASPSVRKMFDITHLDWLLDLSAPERAFPPRPPTGPVPGVTHAARW